MRRGFFWLGEPLRGRCARSRRAIRSISHFSPSGFRVWFRCYPSRFGGACPAIKFFSLSLIFFFISTDYNLLSFVKNSLRIDKSQ
jgi:hypothetical protein